MARRPSKRPAGQKKGPARRRQQAAPQQNTPAEDFIVVGVGASAGGLEALRSLFESVREATNLAFVVIQHLDPARESTLAELLATYTNLTVATAEDGVTIEPGVMYVIAPGVYLSVEDGKLRTSRPEQPYVRLPIDYLLRTLASEFKERAAAVILSGTGTDGSLGVRSIKEAGGLVIAQTPGEAIYDGMPRSAIATGATDLVLPVAEIPEALSRYAEGLYLTAAELAPAAQKEIEHILPDFLDTLRTAKSHDFEFYKPAMLMRRISRRIALHHLDHATNYLSLLRSAPDEQDALFRDCLINVTSFFRDPQAFVFLGENVVPEILKAHHARNPIRIWVPACSTGEEAYSVAMLFLEGMDAAGTSMPMQVFATDVDHDALAVGRRGIYPDSIIGDISPDRVRRFFNKEDHSYIVQPRLRECVVFAVQNVLTDAPFSNLDVVSCRNLLIYLLPEVQERVLQLLHFSLSAGGVLFLGPSETIGGDRSHFEAISQKFRIFRRIGCSTPLPATIPFRTTDLKGVDRMHAGVLATWRRENLFELGQRTLLEFYGPASVLVDQRNEGIYYFGAINRYLTVATGEASQLIFPMAREGLRAKLRTALHEARQGDGNASVAGAFVRRDGEFIPVTIEVRPVGDADARILLVSFVEHAPIETQAAKAGGATTQEPAIVARLEQELEATRRELQASIRDLESSNEELKAANEEAMSLNEEYQSTNEELETSKEELQSLNEELTTLNAELRERVDSQKELTDDLSNLLTGTDIATLFLDRDLRIRFFTPAAKRLFAIIATDIGRPLADLTRTFDDPEILADAEAVIADLTPRVHEVSGPDRRWYSRRIGPYRTQDEKIEGVVITFADVTELKISMQDVLDAKIYAENIIDTVRQPMLVLDGGLQAVSASRSFYRAFHFTPRDVVGRRFNAIGRGEFNVRPLIAMLEGLHGDGTSVHDFEVELATGAYGRRTYLIDVRRIPSNGDTQGLVLVALEDITERKLAVAELTRELLDATVDGVVLVDLRGTITHANSTAHQLFGYAAGDLVDKPVETLVPPRLRERHRRHLRQFFANPSPRLLGGGEGPDIFGVARDGREIPLQISLAVIKGEAEPLAVAAIRDISAQKASTRALDESREAAEASSQRRSQFLARASSDLRQPTQVVGLLAGILSRTVTEPEARELVERLGVVSSGMADVVNALSDIHRLDSGMMEAEIVDFPAQRALERMKTEFGYVARARRLDLRVVPSRLTLRCDSLLFDRMLQNLVSNALNYTTEGKVLIGCRRRGETVRFEVWDTGRGIAEDHLEAIFDPYFRIEPKAAPNGEGLGLGLYIVRRIAELMECRIDVRSVPGKGSMFAIVAPRGALPNGPPVAPSRAPAGAERPAGVLLSGGDTVTLEVLETLFRVEGYEVWTASTSRRALALVEAHAGFPAIIITEERIDDGMTGLDVVRAIRERQQRDLPAIVVTATSRPERLREYAAAHCAVLIKPVKADDIIAHVVRLLERSGVAAPGHAAAPQPHDHETVFVVTGDPAERERLAGLLTEAGHRVMAHGDAEQFLSSRQAGTSGCVVADIALPGISAIELQKALATEDGGLPVLLIANQDSIRQAVSGIEAGAVGVLEAPVDGPRLIEAVEHALERGRASAMGSMVRDAALERLRRLTPREREVTSLLVAGYANKEIAAELGISPRTVENHRASIREKTGIRSLAELVRITTQIRNS